MAPSMVLLKRNIDFSYDETESRGKSISHPWDSRDQPPRPQERAQAILEYLRTFKAHAVVADPPELSSLHILRPPQPAGLLWPCGELESGDLCSADKNLIALYARSPYRGGHNLPLGGYLIYDARNSSLSAIPQPPDDDESYSVIGSRSALVMCNGDDGGRYVLAQLVSVRHYQAAFWLWNSSAPSPGWVLHPARLRLPSAGFVVHLCFSYRGSTLCWVDLLRGIVACDLGDNSEPELRFIPLPKDCTSYNNTHPRYGRHHYAEQLRSMACVGDTIKLVCIDTNVGHKQGENFDLIVYALLPDLSDWTVNSKYNVGNIWADEAYRATGMPKIDPSFPILSIHEDGVIYLFFTYLKLVDVTDDTLLCTGRCRVEYTSQYFIRVDMKNNKLQLYPKSTELRNHNLLVSEISAYQQRAFTGSPE